MAKVRPADAALAQLAALKGMGAGVLATELPKYLANKSNVVVARAADLARDKAVDALVPQLVAAFPRFMEKPVAADPSCAAKQAIAGALYELGADAQDVFLAGIRHVQMEPAWGKPVDTAPELRGLCGLGLARMGYREVLTELADLLVDAEHQARILAARAIAYAGRDEGALLLRLKVRVGDREDVVTAECLLALANLARTRALPFVRTYLADPNPAIAEAAALALGEMRDPAALDVLFDRWARDPLPDSRRALALPIAIARLPRSLEFLVAAIGDEPEAIAVAAVEALAIYRHDPSVADKVRSAVASRASPRVDGAFHSSFDN